EVPAIWRYFEEAYLERPLMGATPKEKALASMWERRMELEGFATVMETVRNKAPHLKGRAISGPHDYEQIPAIVDRGMKRIQEFYEDLEARLAACRRCRPRRMGRRPRRGSPFAEQQLQRHVR